MCFALTINKPDLNLVGRSTRKAQAVLAANKSRDQSLNMTGIDLRGDCFSDGQFYVAYFSAISAISLVLFPPEEKSTNVPNKPY